MLPTARQQNLTVKELSDETLVYDLESNKAHCLNRTSALVWKLCDGKTTVRQLAAKLEQALKVPGADEVVQLALEQLSKRKLLLEPVQLPSDQARVNRREMLKDIAKKLAVAAAALPLVMTMTAPPAKAAASFCAVQCNAVTGFLYFIVPCRVGVCTARCPPATQPGNVSVDGTVTGVCER